MTKLIKWNQNLFPVKFKKQMRHSQIKEVKESGANRQKDSPLIENIENMENKLLRNEYPK